MSKQNRIKQKNFLSFNKKPAKDIIDNIAEYDAGLFVLSDKVNSDRAKKQKIELENKHSKYGTKKTNDVGTRVARITKLFSSASDLTKDNLIDNSTVKIGDRLLNKQQAHLAKSKKTIAIKKITKSVKILALPVTKFLPKPKINVIEPPVVKKDERPFIIMRDIDVKYNLGKANEYHALKNVNLEIFKGELIIFFGPSGCAKSTLVNVIAGLEKPSNGTIEVDRDNLLDYDADTMADYHTTKTGFIFQAYNLIDSLSVEDNIILPQMFQDKSRKKRKQIAIDLMKRFQISEHAKKIPAMLSGGQQQRVGIARSLVNDPTIVLADEPVGNLDSASAEIAIELFRDLSRKENKTLIMVTHNPDLIPIANRVYYMRDGEIIKEKVNDDIRPEAKRLAEEEEASNGKAGTLEKLNITDELKDVLKSFNNLSSDRIEFEWPSVKAKIIRKRILQKYSKEQIDLMDEAIRRRLIGLFDSEGLFAMLDMSQKKGGCGIDKRLAKKLVVEIDRLIDETENLEAYLKTTKEKTYSDRKKFKKTSESYNIIKDLRFQILALYNGEVTEEGVKNLDRFIRFRLENKINKNRFIELTSKNIKKGGAGFNKRVARKFAKDLEFLMMVKFGEERSE